MILFARPGDHHGGGDGKGGGGGTVGADKTSTQLYAGKETAAAVVSLIGQAYPLGEETVANRRTLDLLCGRRP